MGAAHWCGLSRSERASERAGGWVGVSVVMASSLVLTSNRDEHAKEEVAQVRRGCALVEG